MVLPSACERMVSARTPTPRVGVLSGENGSSSARPRVKAGATSVLPDLIRSLIAVRTEAGATSRLPNDARRECTMMQENRSSSRASRCLRRSSSFVVRIQSLSSHFLESGESICLHSTSPLDCAPEGASAPRGLSPRGSHKWTPHRATAFPLARRYQ